MITIHLFDFIALAVTVGIVCAAGGFWLGGLLCQAKREKRRVRTYNGMATELRGELDHVSPYTLRLLKRELRRYNTRTKQWD